jgi:hypothetical protein
LWAGTVNECARTQIEAEEREEIFKGHTVYLEQRRERELERERERERELEEAAEKKVGLCWGALHRTRSPSCGLLAFSA